MATKASEARSSEVKARAEASFRKEERAKDGAKAMMEYQANSRVVREKMAKLKALRLAKEAEEKDHEPAGKAVTGNGGAGKTAVGKAAGKAAGKATGKSAAKATSGKTAAAKR